MIRLKLHLRMLVLIMWDYLRGICTFRYVGPCVTVFGSARSLPDSVDYKLARSLGSALGHAGFAVMTGGGPGLMEAANRGAREAGARSLGCHLELPFEEFPNDYLDSHVRFRYLLTRKLMMFRYSCAFVVLPGGLGTMDELFEVLTLIKTKKLHSVPIVMFGREYWKSLMSLFDTMLSAKTMDAFDVSSMFITDDPHEAMVHLKARVIEPPPKKTRVAEGREFWRTAFRGNPLSRHRRRRARESRVKKRIEGCAGEES